ncbi:MAG TPA: hypothetical protein VLF20_04790 [Patescibacteria group bacterium]|nr:hypothetical protein [Patescibacteria group bacterium]
MAEGQSDQGGQDNQAAFRDSIIPMAERGITTAELAAAREMLGKRSGGSRTPLSKTQPPAREQK